MIFASTVLLTSLFISIRYKDQIIAYFLEQANQKINTPVDVEKIDVSMFQNFPQISVILDYVVVHSSLGNNADTLATARQVQLAFSLLKLISGDYELKKVVIKSSKINTLINEFGEPNYRIIEKRDTASSTSLEFEELELQDVDFTYHDKKRKYFVSVFSPGSVGKIKLEKGLQKILLKGDLSINQITVNEMDYFRSKSVAVDFNLIYHPKNRFLTIEKGDFNIGNGNFNVNGDLSLLERTHYNLDFNGINTNFQTIISLLPKQFTREVRDYNSKGDVYFRGSVKGEMSQSQNPKVNLEFGSSLASFFHPKLKRRFEDVSFEGIFTNGELQNLKSTSLHIKKINLKLDDESIIGDMLITNFTNPHLELSLNGKVNIKSLFEAIPSTGVKSAFGNMDMDVYFSGNIDKKSFKKYKSTYQASGEIQFNEVSFVLDGERLPFNKLNGYFILKNSDLAISNFSGKVGNSDFILNGFFHEMLGILNPERKTYNIQADLRSDFLDFDELLSTNFASRDITKSNNEKYNFSISPTLFLDFNCEIGKLNFRRFRGSEISGNLTVENQIARLDNVQLKTMGGEINMSGSVNARAEGLVEVINEATLSNINIDSVFYVLDNFNQEWLKDENLRGQIYADVNSYLLFDNYLTFNSKAFKSDISVSIQNGELLDFEPMQRLSKFVEEESLEHLKFSDLRNDIRIENRIIHMPKMDVVSNISSITISGTHTFDQEIDYRISVPLKNFLRLKKIKQNELKAKSDGSNLLLKITGTTENYDIAYDTKAVRKKIVSDFKKEGQELKEAFKNKEEESEEVLLEEEEYFDFEEDPQ